MKSLKHRKKKLKKLPENRKISHVSGLIGKIKNVKMSFSKEIYRFSEIPIKNQMQVFHRIVKLTLKSV